MKKDPIKGEWINLVVKDLKYLNMTLEDEEDIKNLSKNKFGSFVTKQIRNAAFKDLEEVKDSQKKVKYIIHEGLGKPQNYLASEKLNAITKCYMKLISIRKRLGRQARLPMAS